MAAFPALRSAARSLLGRGRGDLDARITSGPTGYVVPGQPYNPEWNVHQAVTEGYSWNPYVYRAVEFVAQNERARRIALRVDDPINGPEIDPDKLDRNQRTLLRRLNRQANKWEIAQILRHRLVAQWFLSARGVFIDVVRNNAGGIHSLFLLDPDRVEIVPGRTKPSVDDPHNRGAITPIEAFRVTTGAPGARYRDDRPPWDPKASAPDQPSSILWLRSPHPTILARGTSPMEAAKLSAELDRQARLYNLRFMQEDGRPGGVLYVKGAMDDSSREILHHRFMGNRRPGRVSVVEADEVKYADMSGTPRDMMWSDTMEQTAKEFCVAFGLPMSVITDSSGETFDNADADYAKAWEHGMLPLLRMLDAQLDALTPGGFDDDTFLAHDVSDVWVLGRHQRAREDRAVEDLKTGIRTIDEVREVYGLDPLNVPATRVLWVEPQRLAVDDGTPAHDGDAAAAAAAPMGGGGMGGVPGEPPLDLPVPADPQALEQGQGQQQSGQQPQDGGDQQNGRRALARADRQPAGNQLTAGGEPERKSLEGEQRRERHPALRR